MSTKGLMINTVTPAGVKTADKTVIKAMGLGGEYGGGTPVLSMSRTARIARVRPLHYDWKYPEKELEILAIQRRGQGFFSL